MANDLTLETRQYLVSTLRADPQIGTLLGDANRVYGPLVPGKPEWPFIRVEIATSAPDRATCLDGSIETVGIHCFTKGGSEDSCLQIRKRVIELLDNRSDRIGGINPICINYTSAQLLRDSAEAEAWHGIAFFTVDVGA